MSSEWQLVPGKVRRATQPGPAEPTMGPTQGYLGRVLIEVWTPDASNGDGLRFAVYSTADSSPAGGHRFVRETIARMTVALAGQHPLK